MGQGRTVPDALVRGAVLLLLQSARDHRPGRRDRGSRRRRSASISSSRWRRSSDARAATCAVEEAGAHIAGYTIFNDWSARDHAIDEMRLGLGFCKAKDFANTLGPWIVTADELERFRTGTGSTSTCARASTAASSATTRSPTWRGASRSSSPTRAAGPGSGRATCSAPAPAGTDACSSYGVAGGSGRRSAPGDVVTLSVEGIGTLTNQVVAGVEPVPLPPARPGRLRHRAGV